MVSDTILFQSVRNSAGQPVQQITNLRLEGIITVDSYLNHDCGKLYGAFSYSSSTYTFNLYKDSQRRCLVASATATSTGIAVVCEVNNSGLSGTVNIVPGTVTTDNAIEAIVVLSTDGDIPLANLESTSDYDPVYGFATHHIEAFKQVKTILTSRFESDLWSDNYIDVSQINSGKGGFDLSRILSWRSPDIRQAAAQYVLHLIARRQAVEPGGMFDKRSKCARDTFTALLNSVEIELDTDNTRVPRKTKTLSSFKFGRA